MERTQNWIKLGGNVTSAFHHSYFYMLANTASSTLPSHLDNMIVDPVKLQEQLEAACRD